MHYTDIKVRELDWYLRDHLFRQLNAGKTIFLKESLPREMSALYLKYRGADLQYLSCIMGIVLEALVAKNVLQQNGNELKLTDNLCRLQCSKCFYINYLAKAEPRMCQRCQHNDLHDFPKKKA